MKFINTIAISTIINFVSSDEVDDDDYFSQRTPKLFQPEDVGSGHTKIIQELHQRMTENPPKERTEYISHMVDVVVANLCQPETEECRNRVEENAMKSDLEFEHGFEYIVEHIVPGGIDSTVYNSIENLFLSISLASLDENPQDILQLMHSNLEELKYNMEVMDENDRILGMVAYSVGIESMKQWHEILNTDDNQFHRFRDFQNEIVRRKLRELQESAILGVSDVLDNLDGGASSNLDFINLVESDVIGSAAGLISGGFDVVQGENGTILESALESASLYSATNIVNQLTPSDGGILGEDGIFGGIFNNTGDGDGIFGGIFNNTGNGDGIFGGIFNNSDNDGDGEGGGLFGGIGSGGGLFGGGNNDNNNTGGGLFSNLLPGNNNNDEDDEDGGGFFSGIFGGNNNNDNTESSAVEENSSGTETTNGTNPEPAPAPAPAPVPAPAPAPAPEPEPAPVPVPVPVPVPETESGGLLSNIGGGIGNIFSNFGN